MNVVVEIALTAISNSIRPKRTRNNRHERGSNITNLNVPFVHRFVVPWLRYVCGKHVKSMRYTLFYRVRMARFVMLTQWCGISISDSIK